MEIAKIVAALSVVPVDASEAWRADGTRLWRLWLRLAAEAALRIKRAGVDAVCTPQEWDHRIDCVVRLKDVRTVGEMISLPNLTEERLIETAGRLALARDGHSVQLVNEIRRPVPLGRA